MFSFAREGCSSFYARFILSALLVVSSRGSWNLKILAIWRLKWNYFHIETMSAKDILLEVAEKLPPEATLDDAIYELEFRQAVEQGLNELDRGEGIPIEQVKARIAAWAGK
jgi:hypothetical protein